MEPSFRRPPRDNFRQYNPNYTGQGNPGHTGGMMPYHTNQPARRGGGGPARLGVGQRLQAGTSYAVTYVVVIWAVHIVNQYVLGGSLLAYGVHPLDTTAWWTVFTAPLIHGNFAHLISNTIPGALFTFVIAASGKHVWLKSTLIITLVAGMGTWLIGGVGTVHIGASGVLYGWFAYLLVRGIFNRSMAQLAIGVVIASVYSGLIWGIFPTMPGVSWQAHLCGFIGGIIAGFMVRNTK